MASSASDDIEVSSDSTLTHSRPRSSAYTGRNAPIHPSQKSASRTLLEEPPRRPYRLLNQGSSDNVNTITETLILQDATRLNDPIPPFLKTAWEHQLHWKMPLPHILADVFHPVLVDAIHCAYRQGLTLCFCSLVILATQRLLSVFSDVNILYDRPRDLAHCLAVMEQIMRPLGVKVFTMECDRTEELYGRPRMEHLVTEGTFAEHMSEFFEQLPRFGFGAYRAAELQFEIEAEEAKRVNRMKRYLKRTRERVREAFKIEWRNHWGYKRMVESEEEQQDDSGPKGWKPVIWKTKSWRLQSRNATSVGDSSAEPTGSAMEW